MENDKKLRVLELYSGIGGMHYALKLSKLNYEVIGAVDINHHANQTYQHNFKQTKIIQKTIEGIKLDEYEKLNIDMMTMSPPCQPFTRQGNQNGQNDPRSKSFLDLIEKISLLKRKPKFILMENVKGFDQNEARVMFIEMLKSQNYFYQEFLLSPIQFGIPNSRLRYFLIAKHGEPFCFETTQTILTTLPLTEFVQELNDELSFDLNIALCEITNCTTGNNESNDSINALIKQSQINESYLDCIHSEVNNMCVKQMRELNEFVVNSMGNHEDLYLSKDSFQKAVNSIDIVTVKSTRTSCFTKNYGRFTEGTGSLLKVKSSFNDVTPAKDETIEINNNSLRYLHPKEIANLHCFPNEFEFPANLTTIQKWRLIGNSLNVLIVSILIKLMTKSKS